MDERRKKENNESEFQGGEIWFDDPKYRTTRSWVTSPPHWRSPVSVFSPPRTRSQAQVRRSSGWASMDWFASAMTGVILVELPSQWMTGRTDWESQLGSWWVLKEEELILNKAIQSGFEGTDGPSLVLVWFWWYRCWFTWPGDHWMKTWEVLLVWMESRDVVWAEPSRALWTEFWGGGVVGGLVGGVWWTVVRTRLAALEVLAPFFENTINELFGFWRMHKLIYRNLPGISRILEMLPWWKEEGFVKLRLR